jgi:cytochrome d ubiquinol oxidase subunit II
VFFEPLWTDFRVGEVTGILDWYTLLVGVTASVALALHGALWLVYKTSGIVCERSRTTARRLWLPLVALTGATTLASGAVQPQLLVNLSRYPVGLVCPLLALAGLVGMRAFSKTSAKRAFLSSSAFVLGLVASAGLAIFPQALPARIPGRELTVVAAAAEPGTLAAMLCWWLPGMLLAVAYSYFIYARMPKTFSTGGHEH